jgi:hypothetical protein
MDDEGSFPEGRDPYHERIARYRESIERRAWLIALVVTILGEALFIALTGDPAPALLVSPFAFLIIFFAVRLGARFAGGDSPFVVRPSTTTSGESIEQGEASLQSVRRRAALGQRDRVFRFGAIVLVALVLAAAALWFAGVRDDRRPEVLTWVLLGLVAGNVILMAIELTPHRLLGRLTRRRSTGEISAISVASAYSWLVVGNVLIVVMIGLGLFLVSGQAWRLALFALLAIVETSLLWWRLGDSLEALADASDS